jgi:hypothetical protein
VAPPGIGCIIGVSTSRKPCVDHEVADRLHDAAADREGEARLLVGDQIDVTHAVLLFLVGQAVELLRQRSQRLGEQADFRALDGQFAGAGAKQRADDADDVAEVPALERRVDVLADVVAADIDLDAARRDPEG